MTNHSLYCIIELLVKNSVAEVDTLIIHINLFNIYERSNDKLNKTIKKKEIID